MYRYRVPFIIVIILIMSLAVTVSAQSEVMVTTTDNVQLRSGPGRDFSSLGVVPYNTTLPGIGRNEDSSWVQVNYNGTVGWIATFLLNWTGNVDMLPVGGAVVSPPAASPPAPGSVTAVNSSTLNVRSAPNTGAATLGQLAPGTTITLNGRWGSGNSMWVRFDYGGQNAWAAGWLLTISGDVNALTDVEAAQNAVLGACSGASAPDAAAYTPGAGVHPVLLLNETGGVHSWNNQIGNWGVGRTYAAAQLVACVGAERRVAIETCLYYGPSITRYEYQIDIRIVVAQTGAVIRQGTVSGTAPRYCRQTEPYNLTVLSGNHVTITDLLSWLQSIVAP